MQPNHTLLTQVSLLCVSDGVCEWLWLGCLSNRLLCLVTWKASWIWQVESILSHYWLEPCEWWIGFGKSGAELLSAELLASGPQLQSDYLNNCPSSVSDQWIIYRGGFSDDNTVDVRGILDHSHSLCQNWKNVLSASNLWFVVLCRIKIALQTTAIFV